MTQKKKIIGPYELGKTLGKGTYSTVKRAVHVETGTEVCDFMIVKLFTPQILKRKICIFT